MKVNIFTGPNNYVLSSLYQKDINEYNIGVDIGAIIALDSNIKIDMAIGDFDSISQEKKNLLLSSCKNVIEFDKKKDYTDTYLGVKEALKLNPTEIIIYGGIGKRVDHLIANISLLKLGNIIMLNNSTTMYILDPGYYKSNNKYDYISFFALEDIEGFNLDGFDYELENYSLVVDDPLCISNKGKGTISFKTGTLLVIEENE